MTAYAVRMSGWSSDVCSSDLVSSLATRQSRGYEFPLWLDDNRILVKGVPADEKTAEAPSANILFAARPSEKVEGSTVSVFVSPTANATRGEGSSEERRGGHEGVMTCRTRWSPSQ